MLGTFGASFSGVVDADSPPAFICNVTPAGVPAGAPGSPLVSLPADQADHPQQTTEWWYLIGTVHAGTHTFGYMMSLNRESAGAARGRYATSLISIADVTGNRHYQKVSVFPISSLSASSRTLSVRLPTASLSGPMNHMSATARLPGGQINMTLSSTGPPLYLNGSGKLPFAGGMSFYYSLPTLTTTGTLRVAGHTYPVRGLSWLDHQYGKFKVSSINWRWQAEQLDNGVRMNLATIDPPPGQAIWHGGADVLMPSGQLFLVPITMQAFAPMFKSQIPGKSYPTRWIVKIPSFNSCLKVTTSPLDQEFILPSKPRGTLYEGVSTVTGTFQGKPTQGQAWDEQVLGSAASASSSSVGQPTH